MGDLPLDMVRSLNRKRFHRIWQRAREGNTEGFSEEERRLGKVMLDHSDEYFNQFEFADTMADHQYDPGSEVDPFLHVVFHTIVEKQVSDRDPIEAFQFYNAMIGRKCSRHEALHLLAAILLKFLFPCLREGREFQLDAYRDLLRAYKSRRPDKITDLLDAELDPVGAEKAPPVAQIFDDIRGAFADQSFETIQEAQAFLDSWMGKRNAQPLPEFLGLSPEQMHRLLRQPLGQIPDIVTLNTSLDASQIADAPIVKEALFFLRRLGELQPLKTTAKGNLPRSFAQEFHERFNEIPGFSYPVMSEEDDWKLMALRHILDMAGWIRERDRKFLLTKKGEKTVEDGFSAEDYYRLLEVYLYRFNWASRDGYPELGIIQHGALFSLYLLPQKAKEYVDGLELSNYFVNAFPAALRELSGLPHEESRETLGRAFRLRFLERFCEYFDLVTIQKKGDYLRDQEWLVKVTPLLESAFDWKSVSS
jgi:hypothetical protein